MVEVSFLCELPYPFNTINSAKQNAAAHLQRDQWGIFNDIYFKNSFRGKEICTKQD